MNEEEVRRYWNENAPAWTILSRAGYDLYRNHLNTPAFLENLPAIDKLYGIDIGCGEGSNTRLLAARGARMAAIDIAEAFILAALEKQKETNLNIHYQVASASNLPFPDEVFDFATAFMSFMDMPQIERVLQEVFRVLKPKGFLQFSIAHPCFNTPYRKNLRNATGKTYAIEVGDYFKEVNGTLDEWLFKAPPALNYNFPKFKIPRFTKILSQWVNLLIQAGFILEMMLEPFPDDEAIARHPELQDAQVVAYFLHIRCRKP